ncbi:hypothetical protein [Nocardioides sp. SYSU DS0663]|uniref:hypothetical protein n=1 Tax=Nocardioides sp. SYSU DS0663 TaxID=3416445 RepID=UPI003F4C3AAA
MAEKTTVEDTLLRSTAPIRVPDESTAGGDLTAGYFCSDATGHPVLELDHRLWVFYEDGYPQEGRSAWLHDLANQAGGEIVEIDGVEAWVIPSERPGVRSQILIPLPDSDRLIRIHAPYGVAPSRLHRLATSIDLRGPIEATWHPLAVTR